jgi:hypothetical protein
MTIYRKQFTITGVINKYASASEKLESTSLEPKKLLGIEVAPQTNEDSYLLVYVGQKELTGGGVLQSIIDNDTNFLAIDIQLQDGEEALVKNLSGATARDITGTYVYEITK